MVLNTGVTMVWNMGGDNGMEYGGVTMVLNMGV